MTRHELLFKIEGHVYRRFLAPHFTIVDDREGLPAPPDAVRRRVRVMVTSGAAGASRQDIAALPELALICCVGTGYENVDVEAAREWGIVVTYGAGANASAVADHAFALLLAAMRDIPRFHSLAVTGQWRGDGRSRPIPTGKKLGLIGLGAIGERVARRAAGFEMAVSYHSRTPKPEAPWRSVDSVLRLAEEVDCLVVAVPGGASTFHMIDASVLAALGPAGFLVNVGRGSVVDTEALVAALRSGTIAGAALDVFEDEPLIPEALCGLANVVLTPHVAAHAPEVQAVAAQLLKDNIDRFLEGKPVLSPVPS